MLKFREVDEEILDSLPVEDLRAIWSRKDLGWVNYFMGNFSWFGRCLRADWKRGERLLEVGAGDGSLYRELRGHRVTLAGSGAAYDGLDLIERPDDFGGVWHQKNVVTFDGWEHYDVIVGNLFWHHLTDSELQQVGERLKSGPRLFLASEPARHRWHQIQAGMLNLVGVNDVTRHDAHVSIAAGFRGPELAELLNLRNNGWWVRWGETWTGANRLIAWR